jgi:hypothetical protein
MKADCFHVCRQTALLVDDCILPIMDLFTEQVAALKIFLRLENESNLNPSVLIDKVRTQ